MANSDRGKSSNEKIVDEITKDIEEGLHVSQDQNASDCNNLEENNCNETDTASPVFEVEESEENKEELDTEFNEVALKKAEATLSAQEKLHRQKQAIELKNKGNEEFKNQDYEKGIEYYTEGLKLCPLEFNCERAILYANRAACKTKLDRKTLAIEDCTKAIEFNNKYVKAYIRRAKLYEETEKLDESLEDYKKILELDPGNNEALIAQSRLPPLINEKNEKMKAEMLGKLKDLGNVILRPFGLSTENFQLQQDPNSGGYSINFKQNPH